MLKSTFMKRVFKDAEYKLTSEYGYRVHPITRVMRFHYGEDYGTYRKKVPLYSPVYGVVKESTYNAIRGHYVTIKTPQGLVRMQHLDSRAVKVGQRVEKGTKIGVCGTTGASTGIHLHIEYKTLAGVKLDPDTFIPSYKDPIIARKKVKASPYANVRSGAGTQFADVGDRPHGYPVDIFQYRLDDKGKKWAKIDYVSSQWIADWLLESR